MKNVELSSSDYVLGPEYVIYQKSKHTPSTSKTFQQIIDGLSDTATETNPGIIVFSSNYTQKEADYNEDISVNSSPAVFPAGTSSSKKKFIIYGHGHTYSSGGNAQQNKSSIYINANTIVEIQDLTIKGGQADPVASTTATNGCGGGMYIKGKVILNNVIFGYSTETINSSLWNNSDITANKGGGIYVDNGGELEFKKGTLFRCNMVRDNAKGGGIFIADGGKASLGASGSQNKVAIYGSRQVVANATGEGAAIYCETNGLLEVTNLEIQYCKNTSTPGIYLEDMAIFHRLGTITIKNNETTSTGKIGLAIHCAGKLYIKGENWDYAFDDCDFDNGGKVDFYFPTQLNRTVNPNSYWDPPISSMGQNYYIRYETFAIKYLGESASTFIIGCKKSDGTYWKLPIVKGVNYHASSGNIYFTNITGCAEWE